MTGENDVVGAQSRRSGLGNLVANHPPCSVYFASIASGSPKRSNDDNNNAQRKENRHHPPPLVFSW